MAGAPAQCIIFDSPWLSSADEISAKLDPARKILLALGTDDGQLGLALEGLTRDRRLTVAVISTRSLDDLERNFPAGFILAGNHGLEITGGGLRFELNCARDLVPELGRITNQIVSAVSEWPSVLVENRRLTAFVHYGCAETSARRLVRRIVRRVISLSYAPFSIRAVSAGLEIYPRAEWDKGSAFAFIRHGLGPFDACVSIGEGRSDESIFAENTGQLNLRIGAGQTRAGYHLSDRRDAARFLEHLLGATGKRARQNDSCVDSGSGNLSR